MRGTEFALRRLWHTGFLPVFFGLRVANARFFMAAPSAAGPSGLGDARHVILVLSGKGGVGKSTVACQLAMALAHSDPPQRVGILDVDICGPSVPKICGVERSSVTSGDNGWEPVQALTPEQVAQGRSLGVMSIAFLLPSATDAVVWRGPRKDAMIKQFITNVNWGRLDYLIVDTPPGTSDEHMTLCEVLRGFNPTGAVVVTTPQDVSTDDVRKELSFCAKLKMRCLGIVENMAGFACPCCGEVTDIFGRGGGEKLAEMYQCPFLGRIPIEPTVSLLEDQGKFIAEAMMKATPETEEGPGWAAAGAVLNVVTNVCAMCERVDQIRAEAKRKPAAQAEQATA